MPEGKNIPQPIELPPLPSKKLTRIKSESSQSLLAPQRENLKKQDSFEYLEEKKDALKNLIRAADELREENNEDENRFFENEINRQQKAILAMEKRLGILEPNEIITVPVPEQVTEEMIVDEIPEEQEVEDDMILSETQEEPQEKETWKEARAKKLQMKKHALDNTLYDLEHGTTLIKRDARTGKKKTVNIPSVPQTSNSLFARMKRGWVFLTNSAYREKLQEIQKLKEEVTGETIAQSGFWSEIIGSRKKKEPPKKSRVKGTRAR